MIDGNSKQEIPNPCYGFGCNARIMMNICGGLLATWVCPPSGRIDRKIEFPLPDEKTRRRIFQIHTKKMTLSDDLDLEEYITAKDDLSGADIKVYA